MTVQKRKYSCATCPFWVPNDALHLESGGACKEHGPSALLVGFQPNRLSGQPDLSKPITIGAWGPTGPLDWCYAHPQARMEAIRTVGRIAGATELVPIVKQGNTDELDVAGSS